MWVRVRNSAWRSPGSVIWSRWVPGMRSMRPCAQSSQVVGDLPAGHLLGRQPELGREVDAPVGVGSRPPSDTDSDDQLLSVLISGSGGFAHDSPRDLFYLLHGHHWFGALTYSARQDSPDQC